MTESITLDECLKSVAKLEEIMYIASNSLGSNPSEFKQSQAFQFVKCAMNIIPSNEIVEGFIGGLYAEKFEFYFVNSDTCNKWIQRVFSDLKNDLSSIFTNNPLEDFQNQAKIKKSYDFPFQVGQSFSSHYQPLQTSGTCGTPASYLRGTSKAHSRALELLNISASRFQRNPR